MATSPNNSNLTITVDVNDGVTPKLRTIESSIIRFVGAVSSALAVFGTIVFPVKEAAQLQAELLNVAKTTDFTDDQITSLRRNLVLMSADISLTVSELARIAAIGGQLGLGGTGVDGITRFTETTARFASVIDVSVEQAGNGLAKLLNIFKINVNEVEKIASLLNEVSNNSTASGAELLDIINRIGTAGGTLNIKQSAALAALGRDVGLTVETVGTSFQKVFLDLQTKADKIAPLLGVSVDTFTNKLKSDGIGALKDYLTALSTLPPSVQAAFAEETTGGGRVFGLVNNLINDARNGFQLLDARLENARVGFDGGTSAIREQQRVMQGLLAQLRLVGNAFSSLASNVGDRAIPALTELAISFQGFLRDPATVDRVVQIGEALGSFALAIADLIGFLSQFSGAFGPLLRALEIFIGFKLASYVFDISRGLVRMTQDARNATAAFIALARGRATLSDAVGRDNISQAAAAARGGVQLGGFTAATGQALGAIPLEQARRATAAKEAQVVAEAAVTAQKSAQATLDAEMQIAAGFRNASLAEEARLRGVVNAQQATVLNLEARIRDVRAGNADIEALSLRQLTARLAVARDILATDQAHLRVRQEELLAQAALSAAAIREAQAKVASATATAASAAAGAATAAGAAAQGAFAIAIGGIVGMFTRFASTIGRIFAGIARFIFGPIGLIILTIGTIVASFVDLEKLGGVVARLVGISGTASQIAAQQARLREQRAKIEEEQVKQLADEYTRLQGVIQGFNPAQVTDAIKDGNVVAFLQSISKNVEVVQAKVQATILDISRLESTRVAVDQAFSRGSESINELGQEIEALEERLRNVDELVARSNLPDRDSARASIVKGLTDQLNVAKAQMAELQQAQADYTQASVALAQQQTEAQSTIPRLLQEEANLLRGAAPLYTEQAGALLLKAQAVARIREQLEAQKAIEDQQRRAKDDESKDPEVRARAAATQENIRRLQAQLRAAASELGSLTDAAGPKTKAFIDAFGDGLTTSETQIKRMADLFNQAFSGDTGGLQRSFETTGAEIDELQRKLIEVEALRARVATGSGQLRNLVTVGQLVSADELDAEIVALRSKLVAKNSELDITRRQIGLSQELQNINRESAITDRDILRQRVQIGLQAAAQKIQLTQVALAQGAIADAARRTAEAYKSAYERAANDAAAAVLNATNRIANFQQTIANRATGIKLAEFDNRILSQQREAIAQNDRLQRQFERQLDLMGVQGEEREEALRQYRDSVDAQNEIRTKQQEVQRIQLEYNLALERAAASEKIINDAATERIKLEQELKKATEEKNQTAIDRITNQINTVTARAAAAGRDLDRSIETVTELASRTVSGEFTGIQIAIDPTSAQADIERLTQIAARAATEQAALTKILAEETSKTYTAANTALQQTKQALTEIEQRIISAAQFTGLTVQAFEEAGRKIVEASAEFQTAAATVERIRNLDFTTGVTLPDVAALNTALKQGENAIIASAAAVATQIDALSNGSVRNLGAAFSQALQINIDPAAIQKRITEEAKALDIKIENITFPSAREKLTQGLNEGGPIKVPVELTGTAAAGGPAPLRRAGGGPIYGPGTSTSDSILARLSHGEYVSDARTTGMFGPGFFRFLKTVAHNGPSAVSSFLSVFSSVPLPRFAGGGLAVAGGGGSGAQVANGAMDTVRIVLDIGGKQVPVYSQRDQAQELVRTFKNISRSIG